MKKKQEERQLPVLSVSMRHKILIVLLLGVVIAALVGQYLFKPNRKAGFKIVYTGGIRGHMYYDKQSSAGYEKISALVAGESENDTPVLLIDTGNCLGGSEIAEAKDGVDIVGLMNQMGYSALIPGTYDCIYGNDTLSSLRAEASFPFIAANVKKTDGGLAFENYKIININDVKVGIIGVTDGFSGPQAVAGSLVIEDMTESVRDVLTLLGGKTDAIIVVANTMDKQTIEEIAGLSDVDMVIWGGNPDSCQDKVGETIISSPGQYGANVGVAGFYVGRDDIDIDNRLYKAETLESLPGNSSIAKAVDTVYSGQHASDVVNLGSLGIKDPDVEAETEAQGGDSDEDDAEDRDESESETETEAETEIEYPINLYDVIHNEETGTGDVVADAMLNLGAADGATIAVIPDAMIHGTLAKHVNRQTIDSLFDDTLCMVICQMTGGEIRSMIENSFDGYPEADGFLQIAGISYRYKPSKSLGSHLFDVKVAESALDDARIYIVAMPDVLADGLGYQSASTGRVSNYKTLSTITYEYIISNIGNIAGGDFSSEDGDTGMVSDMGQRIVIR